MDGQSPDTTASARLRVRVRGLVQGVGFRPFVFGLAERHGLDGWVRNDAEGVLLEVEGASTGAFLTDLEQAPPPLARIDALEVGPVPPLAEQGFRIVASVAQTASATAIGPDTAPCTACLEELFDPADRHHLYPFVNCTHCGPRYTLTRRLPYDRAETAMASFPLCAECAREYADPRDRRFHAQAIACPACGPRLDFPPAEAVAALRAGEIVAIKGAGGFQLACDARNAAAVRALRERKARDAKPFAVMVANLGAAARLVELDPTTATLLQAPERPIVLARRAAAADLAADVAPGLATLGLMLPSTPLHYLLFHAAAGAPAGTAWLDEPPPDAWVMTSANFSGEPLLIDDAEAHAKLQGIADRILGHERAIVVRADDSVVQPDAAGGLVVRRARGFVPAAVRLARRLPPVLALGGQLKATLCAVRADEAFLSQHLGDLDDAATRAFLDETLAHLLAILEVEPVAIAHDLHPDAPLTRGALALGLPLVPVQHHHAHLAAIAAEHGHSGPLLGLALDGLGYGPDGTIWGGELLEVDGAAYLRLGNLRPLLQPGGDVAAREPWRMAAAALHALGRGDEIAQRFANEPQAALLAVLLTKEVACPRTSSLGRFFDAAAALLGVCGQNRYEGEAAIRLEGLVRRPLADPRAYVVEPTGELDLSPLLERLIDVEAVAGAELVHGTLIQALAAWLGRTARARGRRVVALGGGCLVNRVLREGLVDALTAQGLVVLVPRRVPPGDGGLSLGQAWVAGHQILEGH